MQQLVMGDLSIDVRERTGAITLEWRGKSNDRYPKKMLGPFFETLFVEAAEKRAHVEMHFEALDYLNSSTISALVGVIRDLRERKIKLLISFDKQQKWQKLCFEALRVFEKPDGLLVMQSSDR
jgi:hypothetical protein